MAAFYLYYPDLIAILLSAILLGMYSLQRPYPTNSGSIYLYMLCVTMILGISDLFAWSVIRLHPESALWLKYLIQVPCLLCYISLNCGFYYYILFISKGEYCGLFNKLFGISLWVITSAFIITTPFTHFIEDLSVPGEVIMGPFYLWMFIINGLLLVADIAITLSFRKYLSRLQVGAAFTGIVLIFAAAIIQYHYPNEHVISVAAAIVGVVCYAALEDPSNYFFNGSKCYNDKAFYIAVGKSIKSRKDRIIIFRIEGYEYVSHMLDEVHIRQLGEELGTFFRKIYGRYYTFCLSNDIYAAVVSREWTDAASEAISAFGGYLSVDDTKVAASLKVTELNPAHFSSSSDVRHIVETVIQQHLEGDGQRVNEMTKESLEMRDNEQRILQCVRHAIKNDGFEIWYQPIYEDRSGKFVSAEALIRLRDNLNENGGFIPPSVFIPLAERNGLIVQIGEIVFESVCKFYTESKLEKLGVEYIEVNLSPIQCVQQDLTLRLQNIMRRYGIGPEHINLEITETAQSRDKHVMQRNIRTLLNRGVTFSLDDFGTGFSNIDNLASLPVSLIKFDKSLIDNALADENSRIILGSLLKMLKCLKYKCVAEGVENEETLAMVREMGCDYFQGYLFSRPVPSPEYIQFLKKN
ncbi:MAG: EAL domain-containing protein [Lachnospiraceae bacterium]|nr:EAL domain-containing protein [Lachnospiraceae bacterium]MBO4558515.1 EAL domain-containing protein [Lachnospiraceae bacterium]MBR5732021.1 EAL domain-containing protein [Lachnospiraceae bacterium]